ncbi:hypothetical protein J4409_01995 [Candidatus Woesearchaeota archaeon]|nr:hypothetical protein [Candidatus Woesearchaeota archaeon]
MISSVPLPSTSHEAKTTPPDGFPDPNALNCNDAVGENIPLLDKNTLTADIPPLPDCPAIMSP